MSNPLFDALIGARATSDEILFELTDGGEISYAEFAARVARVSQALVSLGVDCGDRVLLQVEKSTEALAAYLACIRCGAILVPLNTSYEAAEIEYFVKDAEPALMICDSAAASRLEPHASAAGAALATLDADGGGSFAEAVASSVPRDCSQPVSRKSDDLAAILYTSGTTGRSKGAMLTQSNLLSNARTLVEAWEVSARDRLIHALPIFHTHGLFVAVNTIMLAGARMIFFPKFDSQAVLSAMPGATMLMGVPTFYTRLLRDPALDAARAGTMRLFISGSAPLLPDTHAAFEAATGHRILERYGMTETNMNTSNPCRGERRPGTVGLPLPGVELRLVDRDGSEVTDPGAVGMIEVRGPNVFKGYWRNPEKTAEEFRGDGFFITGDLGERDADGYLSIVGRQKDVIISGGYNIYPREIEEVLDDLDEVVESAVIGVAHPDLGEVPFAVIVPAQESVTASEILARLTGRLARFKCPRDGCLVDSLPRNAMGKVQKAALRDRFADAARSTE